MPYNHTIMEQRLKNCDEKLSKLFVDVQGISIPAPTTHIKAVQDYYNTSYRKAQKDNTIENIIKSYELFVESLEAMKTKDIHNSIGYKDMNEIINEATDSRKFSVLKHNLTTACKLMFWIATTATLYASFFLIALPMLIVQTPIGIAASITIGGFFLATIAKCMDCLRDFKSFKRHDDEHESKIALLGFFKHSEVQPQQAPVSNGEILAPEPRIA